MPATKRFVSRLTRQTLALVLAGGRGSRLYDLTSWRAKPAVPFGGKFRIIDFPLSNCINSGISRVGVLTQYKAHSLIRHIQRGWGSFRGEMDEFVELLPAQQRIETSWYEGTADAVMQNIDIIKSHNPEYVLILAGDHVYKMDYGTMIAAHVEEEADVTVGCVEVPVEEAALAFGVMSVDGDYRVTEFQEKPENPKEMPDKPGRTLASMGIYVFSTRVLFEELERDYELNDSSHDFGKDIIPSVIKRLRVVAFPFRDPTRETGAYWRDVGTVDALWQANLELIGISPELNLYDPEWPIWTYQEQLPPAKFVFDDGDGRRGMALDSMVAGGCIVSGGVVKNSLLFSRVSVHSFSEIRDSVIFPDVDIGRHCQIHKAIIDRGCRIPEGTRIGIDLEEDRERFHVSPKGVVLVTPEMLKQDYPHGL